MFWGIKPKKKKSLRSNRSSKTLRFESLEARQMLTGIVNVSIETFNGVADSMVITGDNSVHDVVVTSTPSGTPDEYTITSKNGDLFTLNGSALPTLGPIAVDGVTGNIIVALGAGGPNTFDMEAPAKTTGSVTTVLNDLDIYNYASQTTIINNTLIQGNLNVIGEGFGLMTFDSTGLQVNGVTTIDNENDSAYYPPGLPVPETLGPFSGDGVTNITNCTFEGLDKYSSSVQTALTIDNGYGYDTVYIKGSNPAPANQTYFPVSAPTTTQIGYTVGVNISTCYPSCLPNALVIQNGTPEGTVSVGSGSQVTLTDAGGTSSDPVVYGSVLITNNNAQPMQSNQVNFVSTIVYGKVFVDNIGGGSTRTSVQQSFLGEQVQANGPVEVVNTGVGQNQYLMTGSELPWGLAIDNPEPSYGNSTIIDSSYIGQTAKGASPQVGVIFCDLPKTESHSIVCAPQCGDVLYVAGSGDGVGGLDTFVLRNNSVVNGGVDLQLGTGDKNVALDSSRMSCFEMTTGTGNDQLWIGGTTITDQVVVLLGTGDDNIWLQEGNTNGLPDSLPNQLSGLVLVAWDGTPGVSSLYYDANDAGQSFPFFLLDTVPIEATVAIPSWALVPSV